MSTDTVAAALIYVVIVCMVLGMILYVVWPERCESSYVFPWKSRPRFYTGWPLDKDDGWVSRETYLRCRLKEGHKGVHTQISPLDDDATWSDLT